MTGDPHQNHDDLARALADAEAGLTSQQPAVAGWGLAVRRRAQRQRTTAIAAAAALAVAFAAVAGTALSAADGPDNLVARNASPSPDPQEPTPAPQPSVEPTPAPTAIVAASPVAPPRSSPTPATEPEPTPEARSAAPSALAPSYPPYGTQKITVTAQVSDTRPQAGTEVTVEAVATGRAEHPPFLQGPRIDDSGPGWVVGACPAPEDKSPPPAQDQRASKTVKHTFETPGRHTMAFRADSACSYYRGSDEITIVFDVQPSAAATSSPAPSA